MATSGCFRFYFIALASVCLFGLQSSSLFVLDLEEFKSSAYELDIIDKPLLFPADTSAQDPAGASNVILSSKLGQQYQCSYDDDSLDVDKDSASSAAKTNVSALLKPMSETDCLKNSFGWWTYEFCYGKEIRQYHIENGEISESTLSTLGVYQSEFNWTSPEAKMSDEYLSQYHSQLYTNGSVCDITNRSRVTSVRFKCNFERGQADKLVSLEEPATCSYILSISTSKICQLEYIKVMPERKTIPISCRPLLHANEYAEYLSDLKARESLSAAVGRNTGMEGSSTVEETLQSWGKWLSRTKSTSSLIVVGMSSGATIDSLVSSIEEALGVEGGQDGAGNSRPKPKISDNVEVQIVNSAAELAQVLDEIKTDAAASATAGDRKLTSQADSDQAMASSTSDDSYATRRPDVGKDDSLSSDGKNPADKHSNDITTAAAISNEKKESRADSAAVTDATTAVDIDEHLTDAMNKHSTDAMNKHSTDAMNKHSTDGINKDAVANDAVDTNNVLTSADSDVELSDADYKSDANNNAIVSVSGQRISESYAKETAESVQYTETPRTDDKSSLSKSDESGSGFNIEDVGIDPSAFTREPENIANDISVASGKVTGQQQSVAPVDPAADTKSENVASDNSESSSKPSDADVVADTLVKVHAPLARLIALRATEEEESNERPPRKLEVKVINAEYYTEDGKPMSRHADRKVMAIFQNNDNEIEEYTRHRRLESNYNFKWTSSSSSSSTSGGQEEQDQMDET